MTTPKETLSARRREIPKDLVEIEHDLDAPSTKDWDDRATERQGDEVLEALGTAELTELRQIDAALDRLDDGSYGICVRCGNKISDERLAALPATPICRFCAGATPH